jgi:hypothetical protein
MGDFQGIGILPLRRAQGQDDGKNEQRQPQLQKQLQKQIRGFFAPLRMTAYNNNGNSKNKATARTTAKANAGVLPFASLRVRMTDRKRGFDALTIYIWVV